MKKFSLWIMTLFVIAMPLALPGCGGGGDTGPAVSDEPVDDGELSEEEAEGEVEGEADSETDGTEE